MKNKIPKGLCQCGCGGIAPLADKNETKRGYIKGQPRRFIVGHSIRNRNGESSIAWKGGRRTAGSGYVQVMIHGHSRANRYGYVLEHILIAEKALGKPLPPGALPHHVNENKSDNRSSNLVVCQDNAYHKLIHKRIRAFKACGHASWLKCRHCQQYDDPINMYVNKKSGTAHHRSCENEYKKRRGGG